MEVSPDLHTIVADPWWCYGAYQIKLVKDEIRPSNLTDIPQSKQRWGHP